MRKKKGIVYALLLLRVQTSNPHRQKWQPQWLLLCVGRFTRMGRHELNYLSSGERGRQHQKLRTGTNLYEDRLFFFLSFFFI